MTGPAVEQAGAHGLASDVSMFGTVLWSAQGVHLWHSPAWSSWEH